MAGIGVDRTSISSFANVRYDIKRREEGGRGASLPLVSNPSANFGMFRLKKIPFIS
jgi:hypothetical protein